MKFFTQKLCVLVLCISPILLLANNLENREPASKSVVQGEYVLLIEGYDWGPGVNKVVLSLETTVTESSAADFSVAVERSAEGVEMKPIEAKGDRKVVHAYVSDAKGKVLKEGNHITLVLFVSPTDALTSPIKYIFQNNHGINEWID